MFYTYGPSLFNFIPITFYHICKHFSSFIFLYEKYNFIKLLTYNFYVDFPQGKT